MKIVVICVCYVCYYSMLLRIVRSLNRTHDTIPRKPPNTDRPSTREYDTHAMQAKPHDRDLSLSLVSTAGAPKRSLRSTHPSLFQVSFKVEVWGGKKETWTSAWNR